MSSKKTQYGDYATWVSFDVLANFQVRLIFTDDLMRSAQERIGSTPDGEADAFCYHVKDAGRSYIFLPLDAPESTVAHEAWHIVYRIMNYIGVKDLDDEIVAYHLDHLIEQIYKFKKAIQSKQEASNGQGKRRAKRKAASAGRNR